MNTQMIYEEWTEKYKPMANHLVSDPEDYLVTFETFGDEYKFVLETNEIDPRRIWTLIDGDEGTYVVDGWHYVNRICYFVTEEPFEGEEGSFCMLDSEYGVDEDDDGSSDEPVFAKLVFSNNPPYGADLPWGTQTFSDAQGLEPLDDLWHRSSEERAASLEAWGMILIKETEEAA